MYARLDSASAHLMTEDDDDDDSAVFDLFLPFRSTAFLSGISELPLEPLLGDCDCLSLSVCPLLRNVIVLPPAAGLALFKLFMSRGPFKWSIRLSRLNSSYCYSGPHRR